MLMLESSTWGSDFMTTALAWVLTYSVHSTVLLGGAWLLMRCVKSFSDTVRDGVWKFALVGGVVTATVQVGFGVRAMGGSLLLLTPNDGTEIDQPVVDREPEPIPILEPVEFASHRSSPVQPKPEEQRVAEPEASAPLRVPQMFQKYLAQAGKGKSREVNPRTVNPKTRTRERKSTVLPGRIELQAPRASTPERAVAPEQADVERPKPNQESVTSTEAVDDSGLGTSEVRSEPPVEEESGLIGAAASLPSLPASPWFLLPWVGSTVLGGLAIVLALVRLRRALLRRTPVADSPIAATFADLLRRSGLKRRVRLSTSTELAAPITFGFFRPEICLPIRALTELDAEQQEAMLAHELAHAVRRDPMWQLISKGLVAAFFFQPLNRLARKQIIDLAEYLSDDWAVAHTGRELPLASCLTEVAEWLVAGNKPLIAPGMADGSRLGTRVYRLLDKGRRRSKRPNKFGSRVVLASAGFIAFAGFVPGIAAAPISEEGNYEKSLADTTPLDLAETKATWNQNREAREQLDDLERRSYSVPQESLAASGESKANSSVLMLSIQGALRALDVEIDGLNVELDSIRTVIQGLKDVEDLNDSVSLIEQELDRLRELRIVLASELPKLARVLESGTYSTDYKTTDIHSTEMNR